MIVLYLLLVPGTAFLAGGAQIWEQNLHPHPTKLNHTLLAVGVLALLLPTALFAALDRGAQSVPTPGLGVVYTGTLLTDATRDQLLRMSRGIAIILLVVYIASRVYLYHPPGDVVPLTLEEVPQQLREKERKSREEDPEMNPWACMLMLAATAAIMATTAEFVSSRSVIRINGKGADREPDGSL